MSAKTIALTHRPTGRVVIIPESQVGLYTPYGWTALDDKKKEAPDAKPRARRRSSVPKTASESD